MNLSLSFDDPLTASPLVILPNLGWSAGGNAPELPGVTLGTAIEKLLAAKRLARRRPKTLQNLHESLRHFARGREDVPVAQTLTLGVIEAWVSRPGLSDQSRATFQNRLSTLANFCVRRGWLAGNPVDRCEAIAIEQRPPRILTVAQSRDLLDFVRHHEPRSLAWFVLALLVGCRPCECDRLTWQDIDLDHGIIRVDAAASKTRQRRLVHPMPNAICWLRFARDHGGGRLAMSHATRRRAVRRVRDALCMSVWHQDVLRHSCASYLYAELQDPARVSVELGHSIGVLLRSYRELVTREVAREFWRIMP
jgi:integrase